MRYHCIRFFIFTCTLCLSVVHSWCQKPNQDSRIDDIINYLYNYVPYDEVITQREYVIAPIDTEFVTSNTLYQYLDKGNGGYVYVKRLPDSINVYCYGISHAFYTDRNSALSDTIRVVQYLPPRLPDTLNTYLLNVLKNNLKVDRKIAHACLFATLLPYDNDEYYGYGNSLFTFASTIRDSSILNNAVFQVVIATIDSTRPKDSYHPHKILRWLERNKGFYRKNPKIRGMVSGLLHFLHALYNDDWENRK